MSTTISGLLGISKNVNKGRALRIAFGIMMLMLLSVNAQVDGTSGASAIQKNDGELGFKPMRLSSNSAIQAINSGDLSNSWVTLNLYNNGQFTLKKTSNGKWLLYPSNTSFISINVDGNVYIQGSSNASALKMDNYITTPLTKVNQNSSYISYTLPGNIKIVQKYELYGQTVKFTTQAVNLGADNHNVKIRYLFDTQLDQNDGSPLYAPTVGVRTYEIDLPNPSFSMWKGYDIYPNPGFESIGTLTSQPYRMVFAWWPNSSRTAWDYTPVSSQKFYTQGYTSSPSSDSAVLFYWNLGNIASNAENSISTFYGTSTPNIGTELTAIESALEHYKNKVNMFYDGYAMSSAEANAKLYKKFPGLAINVTNYFGYKAGIVSESLVPSKLRSSMESLNIVITPEYAELNYLFLNEMYSRVNQGMSEEEIKNIFYTHYMGTAVNQQHFLMGNIGIAPMKNTFNTNYALAKVNLLQNITDENLSPSEISLLATGITNSAESMDDFEPLYSDYNLIAKAYQENRVDNVYIYTTQYSETSSPQNAAQNFAYRQSRINIIDPFTLYMGTAFVVTMVAPIVIPAAYQASITIGTGISSALGSMANYITSLNSVPVGDKVITAVNTGFTPQKIPEDMVIIKNFEDPPTFYTAHQEVINRNHEAYETANDVKDAIKDLVKIYSISIEELNLTDITSPDPNDVRGKMGRANGTIKFKNNGIETTKFSLTYNIYGPTTHQFAVDENIITLAPRETKTIGISYAVPLSELTQMRIIGRYSLTVAPVGKVGIPIPGLPDIIFPIDPAFGLPNRYGAPFKFSIEKKGMEKTGYFYASDIQSSLLNSVSTSVISENNLLNEGESFISQYFTLPSTDRVSFLLPYAGSDIDLHLYDSSGRHVGVNYNTGQIENSIPGARYSGSSSNPEWISVDQTGMNEYSVRAIAIQTVGNESYSILAVESPEFPPLASLNPSNMIVPTLPNTTLAYTMSINEYGGFNSLANFVISAMDFSSDNGEVIPRSNVSFGFPSIVLAGSSINVNVSISVPSNISYGLYRGFISITNNTGDAIDTSTVYIDVTDPEVIIFDANDNGKIEKIEAIQAVVDFFSNSIQREQAIKVVLAYFRFYPVV